MPCEAVKIAEAVMAELNDHSFSQAFTAARYYRPVFDLQDLQTLHVTVVPKAVDEEIEGRSTVRYTFQVDVGVQKIVDPEDLDVMDAMMLLVEEIADFFRLRSLTEYSEATWVGTENDPLYVPEHLHELRQFTSVLTFTFRVLR